MLARAWDAAEQDQIDYLRNEIIGKGLGIVDPSDKEIDKLVSWKETSKDVLALEYMLGDMVSRRAEIGVSARINLSDIFDACALAHTEFKWTTHGHTAVDVNLYAFGKGTQSLRGSHEKTDIN